MITRSLMQRPDVFFGDSKKWLWLSVIAVVLLLAGAAAQAQDRNKVPRIGYLAVSPASASPARTEAFRQGLRELGYVEGKNILIDYRWADGKALMRKGIIGFALSTMLFALSFSVEAQQPKKVPRIGVLLSGSRTPVWGEAFRQALRELGYIEGQNIAIEYRTAEGRNDRQAELARELVAMKVDILVAGGGNDVTRALMQATKSIPIVMTAGSNAVARGLISSLARPGGMPQV